MYINNTIYIVIIISCNITSYTLPRQGGGRQPRPIITLNK